jgi:hypothetical protein
MTLSGIVCNQPLAQGIITFDSSPNWSGTNYSEAELVFGLVIPQGVAHDPMAIVRPGYGNVPQNGTPLMGWFRQYNPYNYVTLSLANGSPFGLSSVHLADPTAPSPSPVPISFIGHLPSGGSITNTFTTPGNGANTFQTYTFGPEFGGFTSVDIIAPRWAMDNLVYNVPEPGTVGLFLLGLTALLFRRVAT